MVFVSFMVGCLVGMILFFFLPKGLVSSAQDWTEDIPPTDTPMPPVKPAKDSRERYEMVCLRGFNGFGRCLKCECTEFLHLGRCGQCWIDFIGQLVQCDTCKKHWNPAENDGCQHCNNTQIPPIGSPFPGNRDVEAIGTGHRN